MNNTKLEKPILAVDVVIFGIYKKQLMVLLNKRKSDPFRDAPALPGIAVLIDETLEAAARRALSEKTELTLPKNKMYLEQLSAFDSLYRDPRGRTVSISYMGITRVDKNEFSKDAWKAVSRITSDSLPFDHNLIVETAVKRLKGKLKYTNIAKFFLPEHFRIEALQEVYESILEFSLNRSNFRNKLLKIGIIEQITVLSDAIGKKGGRPPHLYKFTKNFVEAVDRDFL